MSIFFFVVVWVCAKLIQGKYGEILLGGSIFPGLTVILFVVYGNKRGKTTKKLSSFSE